MDKVSKRNTIAIVVVLILLIGIPFTVYLAQQEQRLSSQAASEADITFRGPNVIKETSGVYKAISPDIQVTVNSPFGPAKE